MASFLLVDYRIHETEADIPKDIPSNKEKHHGRHHHHGHHVRSPSLTQDIPANPHLVYVGPFNKKNMPPLHLLGKCNSICVTLASTGFLLSFIGVCCFAWTSAQRAVSVFASICIVLCVLLCVSVIGLFDTQSIIIKVSVSLS